MMRSVQIFSIVLILLNLTACTVLAPPDEMKSPDMAMVFGNIQIREEIKEVEFREFGKFYMPPFRKPPRVLIFENGTFMAENLKPGKYYIAAVYSRFNSYTLVKDNRTAYQRIINVKPGSINFVGSFILFDTPAEGRLKRKVLVRKARKPSERTLLKQLHGFTVGTGWQTRIDKRLKQLRMN